MTKEEFMDVYNEFDDAPEGYKVVHEEMTDRTRWGHIKEVVVEQEGTGKLFMGIIEITSGDHGPDPELCNNPFEVVATQKTVTVYEPIATNAKAPSGKK